jgi:hypothetical protein
MLAANFESMRLLYLQAETERNAATQRAEDAEAILATIPMTPLLRIVEALLMHGQPLQFDMDAAERWLQADKRRCQA